MKKYRDIAITVFTCLILASLTGCGDERVHFRDNGKCAEYDCRHDRNDGLCDVCARSVAK